MLLSISNSYYFNETLCIYLLRKLFTLHGNIYTTKKPTNDPANPLTIPMLILKNWNRKQLTPNIISYIVLYLPGTIASGLF